ncbi:hypothetical protein NM208_g4138 [Fusarium decemcellulare]|uniref:Uncharacterized protein n=1 Tax=Fusarium decemcellulare TaxID=57161 RepID=A0ACC1SLN0_9HYPO|nr:hypothetical protein NM208_g4138 [Fusarium decemcellulare]
MAEEKATTVEPMKHVGANVIEQLSNQDGHSSRLRQLRAADADSFYGNSITDSYQLKSELVAQHLRDIGFGKFQWRLFVVNGLGWMVDNFWSQGIAAVRPPIANEFTDIGRLSFSSIAYYVGMIIGAFFWGTAADVIGRKLAFNSTIFYGGIFAGNVPVDSIIFLEFIPSTYQWLLVTLSGWWNTGQLIVSLLAWVFLSNFACSSTEAPCALQDNMGWRFTMITLGGMAIAFGCIRILLFKIPESPRYLISKGRDAEAVDAVNYIARYNGKPETLTLDMLQNIDRELGLWVNAENLQAAGAFEKPARMTHWAILKESFKDYSGSSYKRLFAGRKLAQHTSILFIIWLTVGIAYPLYFAFITSYLQSRSTYVVDTTLDHTYKVYCIVSTVGVVGPIAAGFCVETRFGRRWMMAISSVLTGIFLFASTSVRAEASDIGFQCATAILGNFQYAIMFAFTPESFPGPVRGTGTGVAATLLRSGGLVASFISTYVGFTAIPIFVSAALWVLVGVFCLGLPFETRGRASL